MAEAGTGGAAPMIRRRYVDAGGGQIHLRESGWRAGGVPLVCLHATAYSSRSFTPLMRAFGDRHHLIAVDAPGYGESDAPTHRPDIAGYADTIAQSIAGVIGTGTPFDIFGYHTGVAMAAEIAIAAPGLVRRMVWLGVPYFQALNFEAWRQRLAGEHSLGAALSQFDERWDYLVTSRSDGVSLERGFGNFVDELKAWPNGSWAHAALFGWDADGRLPLISQPTLILNPQGHLAEPSRAVASLMPNSDVTELRHLSGAVLETAPAEIAALTGHFLGCEHSPWARA